MAGERKSKTPATARVRVSNTRNSAGAGQKSEIHPPLDVEAAAVAARARRVALCEAAVQAAVTPILQKHRCRLVTVQQIVDGQPGPVQIKVAAND